MSRIVQYMDMRQQLEAAFKAHEIESVINRLLDEIEYIWAGTTECERDEVRRLIYKGELIQRRNEDQTEQLPLDAYELAP